MNAQLVVNNPMSAAVQPSVSASFASVAVYPQAASQADFVAFGMASIGADAAAPVSDVWGLPCSSLVGSTCTETNKRHNSTNKPATTWLLRPSGVQGDPPV